MKSKYYFLFFLLLLHFSCKKNNEIVDVNLENALIISSRQYIFSYIKDNVDDYEYVYFEKKFQDEEIVIYEFSSQMRNYNDTIAYSRKFNIMNVDVFVNDFEDVGNVMIIGDLKYNILAFYDPSVAILILNKVTGKYKVVNFGQQYMPFIEMICSSKDIINSLKE